MGDDEPKKINLSALIPPITNFLRVRNFYKRILDYISYIEQRGE